MYLLHRLLLILTISPVILFAQITITETFHIQTQGEVRQVIQEFGGQNQALYTAELERGLRKYSYHVGNLMHYMEFDRRVNCINIPTWQYVLVGTDSSGLRIVFVYNNGALQEIASIGDWMVLDIEVYDGPYEEYAFLSTYDWSTQQGNLVIIDISDMHNPVFISQLDNIGGNIELSGRNYLFVGNDFSLKTIDITDLNNPFVVWQSSPHHFGYIEVWEDFLFCFRSPTPGGAYMEIYNITNPASPIELGDIGNYTFFCKGMDIDPTTNYLYCASWGTVGGRCLVVIDFSDPNNPNVIGEYNYYNRNGFDVEFLNGSNGGTAVLAALNSGIYYYDIEYLTDVKSVLNPVQDFYLYNNFPNPFNPSTIIKYQIPELSFVTLKVYDVLGSEIASLVDEEKLIGSYTVEFDASSLSSGVYFYRLQAGSFVETKKMILIK